MIWRDVIELGQGVESIAHGESIFTFAWRTVFANKRSVGQSELNMAANQALKPEIVFEVRAADYQNDERVRFNGRVYTITRTSNRGDNVMLTVAAYVGSEI